MVNSKKNGIENWCNNTGRKDCLWVYLSLNNTKIRIAEKKKLPITFHGCRHSHDTLLFRHHVDTKLVADRAGRDEDLTRKTYEHVLPDMQDEVAQLLEEVLFKKKDPEQSEGK